MHGNRDGDFERSVFAAVRVPPGLPWEGVAGGAGGAGAAGAGRRHGSAQRRRRRHGTAALVHVREHLVFSENVFLKVHIKFFVKAS